MKKISLIIGTLLITGCSTSQMKVPSVDLFNHNDKKEVVNGVPVWVDNPPVEDGKVIGIGIAPRNLAGAQAQRKSAVAKAINEIASQLGTTVHSQVTTSASVHNGSGSKSMSAYSIQTVDGRTVRAFIKKTYRNPSTGYLYIMMEGKVQ